MISLLHVVMQFFLNFIIIYIWFIIMIFYGKLYLGLGRNLRAYLYSFWNKCVQTFAAIFGSSNIFLALGKPIKEPETISTQI